jgi:hypothetical protein
MLANWYRVIQLAYYSVLLQFNKHRHIIPRNMPTVLKHIPHESLPISLVDFVPSIPKGFGPIANVDTSIYESGPDNCPGDPKFFSDGGFRHPLLIQGDQLSGVDRCPISTSLGTASMRNETGKVFQSTPYRAYGNPEFVGQLLHRHPGFMKFEQVRRVRQFEFRGHVYDLQTSTGWMGINNVIVQQCRCTTTLKTISDAARAGVEEARLWLQSGRKPENPTYCLDKIPFRPTDGFGVRHGPLMTV